MMASGLARPMTPGAGIVTGRPGADAMLGARPGQTERDGYAAVPGIPISLKLIALVLFIPPELSFFVGELRFTVERLVLILLTPLVLIQLARKLTSRDYCFVWSDVFVPLAAFWMFLGPAITYDIVYALHHSGPVVLEFLITYASTRILLAGHGQALRFINLLCILIALVVLDAALDTASGMYLTRELFGRITGFFPLYYNPDLYRLGFLRAMGPIDHPILFGFTAAIGLLLSIAVRIRWRRFCICASGLGLLLSLSSAPQQCAFVGLMCLVYSRIFWGQRWKWLVIALGAGLFATVLFLSTDTPFGHLFDFFTIDPQTAYYRLYIWQMVGPAILENPLISVPTSGYDYQGSIDSLWLVLALTYGLPCSILTALSMMGACSLPVEGSRARLTVEESKLGSALSIVIFMIIYMGLTVHFWGITWILIGLLVGVRAHLGELGQKPDENYHRAARSWVAAGQPHEAGLRA
jgi:hypothetical protein